MANLFAARARLIWFRVLVGIQLSFVALMGQAIPVAVLDFDGVGISKSEAVALSNRLRNELFKLGAFEVVDRGMMETIMAEQDFQTTGCTSNDCLVEVGRLIGAQQMIGGSVSKVGDTYSVSCRIVDVETGKLLGVSDYDLSGKLDDMLTKGMRIVALKLSGFEEGAQTLARQQALAVTTPAEPPPIVTAPVSIPDEIVEPVESGASGLLSARDIFDSISLKDLQSITVGDSVYIISYRIGKCTWELGNVLKITGDGKRVQVEIDGRIKTITTTLSQLIKITPWLIPYSDGFSGRALSRGDHVIGYSFKNNSLSKAIVKGISQGGYVALEGSNIVRGIRKIEKTTAHISSIGLIIDLN